MFCVFRNLNHVFFSQFQIEVRSLANHVGSIPNVKAFIDVHAYSQYWMFAYAYTYSRAPDHGFLVSW